MRYFTPVKMAVIKRQEIASIFEDAEKREFYCTKGGM